MSYVNTSLEKIKNLLNKLNDEIAVKKGNMTSLEFDEYLLKQNKNIRKYKKEYKVAKYFSYFIKI